MKELFTLLSFLGAVSIGSAFTKYGRSCKDIGCPSTQECVMETDPCSYYQRQGECGSFPTCKRKGSSSQRTCKTYVCPPSQVCKMDGDTPKCHDDASKSGHVGYDTHSANAPLIPGNAPSAPSEEGGHQIYPQIPKGETTSRPNIRPPVSGGSGYQGGQIGSGYPGYPPQTGGYPQGGYNPGGHPQGYPQGGYQGNPQGGYQGNPQGGYQGYPQGGYNNQQGGYQQYPAGYNPYQQQYPQKSSGSSITDKIKDGLKSIGTNFLKDYLVKAFSGGGRN